jgi:drug/metabolite transporter (DMT)-like permease
MDSTRDDTALAVGAVLTAVFALSLGDALIKQQSASFVLWQIFVLRSALVVPLLAVAARKSGGTGFLLPNRFGWTLLRSLVLVAMWVFYFSALPHVELAIAAAAYYTLPVFITLFAAVFLGDRISLHGWLAVELGFAGTLLVLQPRAGAFNAYVLLPVVSAVCYAAAMIPTRSKCRAESPATLSL